MRGVACQRVCDSVDDGMKTVGGQLKHRVCQCCHEARPTGMFSWNAKAHDYCPNCKDCGQWLFLFRKVFGSTRDWGKSGQRKRDYDKRITGRAENVAAVNLWNAWNGIAK